MRIGSPEFSISTLLPFYCLLNQDLTSKFSFAYLAKKAWASFSPQKVHAGCKTHWKREVQHQKKCFQDPGKGVQQCKESSASEKWGEIHTGFCLQVHFLHRSIWFQEPNSNFQVSKWWPSLIIFFLNISHTSSIKNFSVIYRYQKIKIKKPVLTLEQPGVTALSISGITLWEKKLWIGLCDGDGQL